MEYIGNRIYRATQTELDGLTAYENRPKGYEPKEGDVFRGETTGTSRTPMLVTYIYHPLTGLSERWFMVEVVAEGRAK